LRGSEVTATPLTWDCLSAWEIAPEAAWDEDEGQLIRAFDSADAAIEFLTTEGRRRAAAERERRRYRRKVLGIGLFTLALHEHAIIDRLIERGLIDEDESVDHERLEAVLAELLEDFLTRQDQSGEKSVRVGE
jgi:hypothetical protein